MFNTIPRFPKKEKNIPHKNNSVNIFIIISIIRVYFVFVFLSILNIAYLLVKILFTI